MPRYMVSGLPPAADRGMSAFLPHFNRLAGSGAQSYKFGVTGGPVNPVPARTTDTAPGNGDLLRLAQLGGAQSSDAPQAWWPNQYMVTDNWGNLPGAGMPVERYNPVRPQDTTMVPVPATSPRMALLANQASLARGVSPGGQRDISAWARGLRQWLGRNSTTQGGPGG